MDLKEILYAINHFFTLWIVFPAIAILGGYLTYRLRVPQLTKLALSAKSLLKKENGAGNISRYQAMSSVLAGNFGTGNISGIAIAIATGGPGALVWMWIMAFFGAAIQYASCLLGVKYRFKNDAGEYCGGPMYYLARGLGQKRLGAAFAIVTIGAAFTVGNLTQVHSISLPLAQAGITPLTCALTITACAFLVILGGIERVAKVASTIVPLKAILYLGTTLVILSLHADLILPALKAMFNAAFDFHSAAGGAAGFTVAQAITSGFDRGLFATDAGTGIVPILQSSARTSNPVTDGIATLIAPFLVMIVCTMTGLTLIVTGAWQQGLQSTNMVTFAFVNGLESSIGFYIVVVCLMLFAYTTVIAWAFCGVKAMGFLYPKGTKLFQICYISAIPLGAFMHVGIIWGLADIFISLMLVFNVIGVAMLSKQVIDDSRAYFAEEEPTHSIAELTNA